MNYATCFISHKLTRWTEELRIYHVFLLTLRRVFQRHDDVIIISKHLGTSAARSFTSHSLTFMCCFLYWELAGSWHFSSLFTSQKKKINKMLPVVNLHVWLHKEGDTGMLDQSNAATWHKLTKVLQGFPMCVVSEITSSLFLYQQCWIGSCSIRGMLWSAVGFLGWNNLETLSSGLVHPFLCG